MGLTKGVFLSILFSTYVNAQYYGPMTAPGGSSSLYELHIVSNEDNDNHKKWRCDGLEDCFEVIKMLKSQTPELKGYTSVWLERFNERLSIK